MVSEFESVQRLSRYGVREEAGAKVGTKKNHWSKNVLQKSRKEVFPMYSRAGNTMVNSENESEQWLASYSLRENAMVPMEQ